MLASAVPLPSRSYKTAFPRGVDNNSNGYGNQIAISLPTRWATVVASGYMGADLRFFFGGQLLSNYNSAAGYHKANGLSVDGSSTVFFGTNAAGQAVGSAKRGTRLRRIHPGRFPDLALVQCRPEGPECGLASVLRIRYGCG